MFAAQKSIALLYIYIYNMCIYSNNDQVVTEFIYCIILFHYYSQSTLLLITLCTIQYFSSNCSTEQFANNGIYCMLL